MALLPIALITDFSVRDPFAGIMKGVIAQINQTILTIDITHEIENHSVRHAKFVLNNCLDYFPKGTVFCVVVDPGVGSERKCLAIKTKDYFFIGPDNGVFGPVFERYSDYEVREITNPSLMLDEKSQTFHGRDIFAPVSAHLANGINFEDVGPKAEKFLQLGSVLPEKNIYGIKGRIEYVDHFGNAITNISIKDLEEKRPKHFKVKSKTARFVNNYAEGEKGELCCLISSGNSLEFFIRNSSAAREHSLQCDDEVEISFDEPSSHAPDPLDK